MTTSCEVVVFFVGKFYNNVMVYHGNVISYASCVTVEAY